MHARMEACTTVANISHEEKVATRKSNVYYSDSLDRQS
jgi:hypothetical protein